MQARMQFGSAADVVSFLEAFARGLGLDPDVQALGRVVLVSQVAGFNLKAALEAVEAHLDEVFPDGLNPLVRKAIVGLLDAVEAHL